MAMQKRGLTRRELIKIGMAAGAGSLLGSCGGGASKNGSFALNGSIGQASASAQVTGLPLIVVTIVAGLALGAAYWRCRCDCGTEVSVSRGSLRGGSCRSCGRRSRPSSR